MCGICGIYIFDEKKKVERSILEKMTKKLIHRGPDGEGYFLKRNIGLGHTRLIIIDPETGKQPMSNEDDTIWIVFNGEIYNYVELREFLIKKGHIFKTKSDTEVIIHLYEEYGEGCLEYLRGMFAFAIWDEEKERLLIARDRIGKKPIYYYSKNGKFVFASEIKAILEFPEYRKEINFEGINYLFAYDWWIPWPYTGFKDIYKMEPATYFIIEKGKLKEKKYWIPDFKNKIKKKEKEIIEEFYELINESVRLRLRSDVPFGALLSGGVDSSSVVAIMKDYVSKVKTFSLGFEEGGEIDPEFLRAREIAKKLGTEHYEILFTPEDLVKNISQLIINHDEPYVCITGLYTWFLTKFIKEKGVTVVLSGNGPDEVFWGYPSGVSLKIKTIISKWSKLLPNNFYEKFSKVFPEGSNLKERIKNLGVPFPDKLEEGINENFLFNTEGLFTKNWPEVSLNYGGLAKKYFDEVGNIDLLDAYSYMAYMLTYAYGLTLQADLDGMANAVEIRSPFLDQKIIEFAAKLSPDLKVKGFTTKGCKYILKKTMEKKLPKSLLYAKKFAFGAGINWEGWIVEKYGEKIKKEILNGWWVKNNYFSKEYIEKIFAEKPETRTSLQILRLYTLEMWYKSYIEK